MLVSYWSILVPRASRPHTSSLGPGTHGTGSARKLAVVSKVHALELGTLALVTIFRVLRPFSTRRTFPRGAEFLFVFSYFYPKNQKTKKNSAPRVKFRLVENGLYEETKYLC
jgi:hypothetical protein